MLFFRLSRLLRWNNAIAAQLRNSEIVTISWIRKYCGKYQRCVRVLFKKCRQVKFEDIIGNVEHLFRDIKENWREI